MESKSSSVCALKFKTLICMRTSSRELQSSLQDNNITVCTVHTGRPHLVVSSTPT